MAVPVIQSRQDSDSGGVVVTSLNVTLPAGSIEGSYLQIIVGQDETSTVAFSATNFGEYANGGDGVSDAQLGVLLGNISAAQVSQGYVTVSSTGSDEMWAAALRITGALEGGTPIHGTTLYAIEGNSSTISTGTTSTQTTINDCLTFAAVSCDGADMIPLTISGTDWDSATIYNLNSGTGSNDSAGAYASIDVATAAQVSAATFTDDGTGDGKATILWSLAPEAGGAVTVTPTGVAGTGAVGSVSIEGKANVSPTGVAGSGQVGPVTILISEPVTVSVTGVAGTGLPGSVTVAAKAVVSPTGVAGTGAPGSVTIEAKAVVLPSGVSGSGEVGAVSVLTGGSVIVAVTGVAGIGAVGSVTIDIQAGTTSNFLMYM